MNKVQAAKIIGTNPDVIRRLVKEKKLSISLDGQLDPEEVEAVRRDWEQRRNSARPKWIKAGGMS